MESVAQDTVAGVIQQPEGVLFTKALKADPLLVVMVREKVSRGLHQERPFALLHFFKVHISMMAGQPGDAVARNPPGFYQLLQANEQRVAGEGGKGGVGGIAVTRGAQREHLPEPLFGGRKKIGEGIGGGTKVSNTPIGR